MNPSTVEIFGSLCLVLAVIHTFATSAFHKLAARFPKHSINAMTFHVLGEVEAVFGIWALIFLIGFAFVEGITSAMTYLGAQHFTEPAFVFVIMCVSATRPVVLFAENCIWFVARSLPLPERQAFYLATLILGPLLGSLITEPAAMTVTALILVDYFYREPVIQPMSERFKYATLGLLFVNISIGGTLTQFAAPPVLMVAAKYGWGFSYMLLHFGWKSSVAVVLSTVLTVVVFRGELSTPLKTKRESRHREKPTWWIFLAHLTFLAAIVWSAHNMLGFFALFLAFVIFTNLTRAYQEKLKFKESLLVGFFLAGLVVLGTVQKWWLQDLLVQMGDRALYFGALGLTAFTDNAALTYLGSLVDLSESAKYSLVAGAVTGGGLTVIANAPNPAGFGILKNNFSGQVIHPLGLLAGAVIPTLIAILCFVLLPTL